MSQRRTLLIVDDSEADQDHCRRTFKNEANYRLESAMTAEAGLLRAQAGGIDVILVDYNLPDMNGIEFMRRAGEGGGDVPIVMLTGSGNETVAVEAMKCGAADYLVKELDGRHLKLLPTVVERVIREYAMREAKRAAEAQLRLAANVFHNITEGILTTDPGGTIVAVNPALTALTGYRPEELIGRNPRLLKSDRHGPEFYRALWAGISQQGAWQGDIWNRRKDGSVFLSRETITAIRDDQGRIQHYVAVLLDITESRQMEEFMRHQAYHDPLTELPNRSLFMDRLTQQLAVARRNRIGAALLFVDLDYFKNINDDLGHEVGDELLKTVARRLKACVREEDTVARLGGDEFTAILAGTAAADDAAVVAQKILDQLGQPIHVGRHELSVSASIGIALFPAAGEDAAELVKAADAAMYRVKRSGRGGYAVADAG